MPYPGQFVRLVMIGELYAETFNMTLNIVPSALGEIDMPEVTTATIEAVAGRVATWFSGGSPNGPAFSNQSRLVSIKLNRINPDGRYADNEAMEHVYPAPIVGSSAMGGWPAQLSTVATLKTALARGRGSRGRMYLIPNAGQQTITTDGRVTVSAAAQTAHAVTELIESLNAEYTLIGRVGVASNVGAGRFEHVTAVAVGRVVDTMRSRRTSLVEDYQEEAVG